MSLPGQTVAQTIDEVALRRPAFAPVLRAFEPLLSAQAGLVEALKKNVRAAGLILPPPQAGRAENGVPLLAGENLRGIAGPLGVSAEKLLPLLGAINTLKPHIPALADYFTGRKNSAAPGGSQNAARYADSREALAAAVTAGDYDAMARIAKDAGLDAPVFGFVSGFIVPPVLRAVAAQIVPDDSEAPWDSENIWRQGYCPVCGAFPSVSWLDRPAADEKNAFLAGGGGKKHLHCGVCGANWKFRRGACPSCGEDSGAIETLRESENSLGERLDWCTKCKSYCPVVDLRERGFVPDMDAAAAGMMHLDMVAARKNLKPLRPAFWNMF